MRVEFHGQAEFRIDGSVSIWVGATRAVSFEVLRTPEAEYQCRQTGCIWNHIERKCEHVAAAAVAYEADLRQKHPGELINALQRDRAEQIERQVRLANELIESQKQFNEVQVKQAAAINGQATVKAGRGLWNSRQYYQMGDLVTDKHGMLRLCVTPGMSSFIEPEWPTQGTFQDGSVIWQTIAPGAPAPEIIIEPEIDMTAEPELLLETGYRRKIKL